MENKKREPRFKQQYDSETIELCELGSCQEKPKILATIKSLISRKIGREYIGL